MQVAALEAAARDAPPPATPASLSPRDPWAALPSAGELLPDIVRLWHEMHVPLLGRSQFLVAHAPHADAAPYYYMAEHAHLQELQQCALSHLDYATGVFV
jgi:hypothetical protein